jgi:hypothetical protein
MAPSGKFLSGVAVSVTGHNASQTELFNEALVDAQETARS